MVADHYAKGDLGGLEDVELRIHEMVVHLSPVMQVVDFWAQVNLVPTISVAIVLLKLRVELANCAIHVRLLVLSG